MCRGNQWTEIVKQNIRRDTLHRAFRVKILKAREISDEILVRVAYKPEATTLYIENVRCGPIRVSSTALRRSLASRAMLGPRFVGRSVQRLLHTIL